VVAGSAGPLGLVEEAYAAAEFDLAGIASLQLVRIGVAVNNRGAAMGATLRADGICFSLSHDSVLACLDALLGTLLELIKFFILRDINPRLICPLRCGFLSDQAGPPESLPTSLWIFTVLAPPVDQDLPATRL
jgi:hypothetical protein